MKRTIKNKYLIFIAIIFLIAIILLVLILHNKKNVVSADLYSMWRPGGAEIVKEGNSTNYDDYDKKGYIIISKDEVARCTKDEIGYNNCINYKYTGDSKIINIESDIKYLKGKFLYEVNDGKLKLIKENEDGSRIIYSYGSPKG